MSREHGVSRRTVLRRACGVTVASATVAGVASARRVDRYDPLPDEPGFFLEAPGRDGMRYVGPPENEDAHVEEGCEDEESPGWFCECDSSEECKDLELR